MKKLLLSLIVAQGLMAAPAFAVGPNNFEDVTTFNTTIDVAVPACPAGKVLTYMLPTPLKPGQPATYGCTDNMPTVNCAGGGSNAITGIIPTACKSTVSAATCPAGSVVTSINNLGQPTCQALLPPVPTACPHAPYPPTATMMESIDALGNTTCGPPILPACAVGQTMTSLDGVNFTCETTAARTGGTSDAQAGIVDMATTYNGLCSAAPNARDSAAFAPFVAGTNAAAFGAGCTDACNRLCQTNGFAGGQVRDYDYKNNGVGCDCTGW